MTTAHADEGPASITLSSSFGPPQLILLLFQPFLSSPSFYSFRDLRPGCGPFFTEAWITSRDQWVSSLPIPTRTWRDDFLITQSHRLASFSKKGLETDSTTKENLSFFPAGRIARGQVFIVQSAHNSPPETGFKAAGCHVYVSSQKGSRSALVSWEPTIAQLSLYLLLAEAPRPLSHPSSHTHHGQGPLPPSHSTHPHIGCLMASEMRTPL